MWYHFYAAPRVVKFLETGSRNVVARVEEERNRKLFDGVSVLQEERSSGD